MCVWGSCCSAVNCLLYQRGDRRAASRVAFGSGGKQKQAIGAGDAPFLLRSKTSLHIQTWQLCIKDWHHQQLSRHIKAAAVMSVPGWCLQYDVCAPAKRCSRLQRLGTYVRSILTGGSLPDAMSRAAVAGTDEQGLEAGLTPPTPLGALLSPVPVSLPMSHLEGAT